MHILLHDFAGHPFTAELARTLAQHGHKVDYVWFCRDSGPKGRLARQNDDPESLQFHALGKKIDYSKTNFVKRRFGDVAYGKELRHFLRRLKPEIVISGNTPTEAQEFIVNSCRALKIPFIYWCQDFYSIAASRLLAAKLPVVGHIVGAYYRFLERRQMRRAARIIHITEAFCQQTDIWGIPRNRIEVIPNWGALGEIDVRPHDNAWSQKHGLKSGTRFIYSGTLAMKHNPALLLALAKELSGEDELIVIAAGVGADYLGKAKARENLENLRLLPLQPFEDLPYVLGSADVLLAVIERDAGTFSVPSKILSYLCAGRPIVLAAPKKNLASRILTDSGAGIVVKPEDVSGFVAAARQIGLDTSGAEAAGKSGRAYAEENFQLTKVAERFVQQFNFASNR